MKLEIFVKNKDLELAIQHIEKFIAKYLKGKNKIELKKASEIDILNHALSEPNYQRIINFYIDDNLIDSALSHIAKLLEIKIIVSFKYANHGNLILVNNSEVIEFIQNMEVSNHEAVNKLYQ